MRNIYIPGETTYDIIFKNDTPVEAKVGGSQLNTAVSLGRLNLPVSMITRIGNDTVGNICASFIKANGIDVSFVSRTKGTSRVSLAFLDQNNNADYTFLEAENQGPVHFPELKQDDIILFGSSFAIRDDIRTELLRFLRVAKQKNAIIIYDPNFRKSNSSDQNKRIERVKENMQMASIVKGSDDDFVQLFGAKNAGNVWKEINKTGVKVLFYTAGKKGVAVHWGKERLYSEVPEIRPLSTIGAGDSFTAGLIYSLFTSQVKMRDLDQLSKDDFLQMVNMSTSFAQEVCLSYENYISKEFAQSIIQD
jgi:fructokinase